MLLPESIKTPTHGTDQTRAGGQNGQNRESIALDTPGEIARLQLKVEGWEARL